MTEIDWLTCADPQAMLAFLRGRVDDRKLRLFAAACCGRVQDLFTSEGDREALALAVVEQFADGVVGWAELSAIPGRTGNPATAHAAAPRAGEAAAGAAAAGSALRAAAYGDLTHPKGQGDYYAAEAGEKTAQCRLLRDLCGNPFRPVIPDPGWRTSTVLALARAIYGGRDFDQMPILADALEDAGCAVDAVLTHCRRGPGPHVRGCWVIDMLLEKGSGTPI